MSVSVGAGVPDGPLSIPHLGTTAPVGAGVPDGPLPDMQPANGSAPVGAGVPDGPLPDAQPANGGAPVGAGVPDGPLFRIPGRRPLRWERDVSAVPLPVCATDKTGG